MGRKLLGVMLFAVAGFGAAGCVSDVESVSVDGALRDGAYALFHVENDRQQQNDLTITVGDSEVGATYVLLYSPTPPINVGWFELDPDAVDGCSGAVSPRCEIPGYGFLVDEKTIEDGDATVVLAHSACGCHGDDVTRDWESYYAVMRISPGNPPLLARVDVVATRVSDYATEPQVEQLQ